MEWENVKQTVIGMGKFAWLNTLAAAITWIAVGAWRLYWGILGSGFSPFGTLGFGRIIAAGVFFLICGVMNLVLTFIYVLPKFSKKIQEEDWQYIVDDKVGTSNLMKSVLYSIILIVLGFFGSALMLICALIIMKAAPVGAKEPVGAKKPAE